MWIDEYIGLTIRCMFFFKLLFIPVYLHDEYPKWCFKFKLKYVVMFSVMTLWDEYNIYLYDFKSKFIYFFIIAQRLCTSQWVYFPIIIVNIFLYLKIDLCGSTLFELNRRCSCVVRYACSRVITNFWHTDSGPGM